MYHGDEVEEVQQQQGDAQVAVQLEPIEEHREQRDAAAREAHLARVRIWVGVRVRVGVSVGVGVRVRVKVRVSVRVRVSRPSRGTTCPLPGGRRPSRIPGWPTAGRARRRR